MRMSRTCLEAKLRIGIARSRFIRLHHVTIDRQPALEEYLRDELPGPLPAAILARSRAFELFVDATPGMSELLMIGKVWELAQRPRHRRGAPQYDLVVLDGPAERSAGRAAGGTADVQLDRARGTGGPPGRGDRPHARGSELDGVVAVATAEQMAVSETLALRAALRGEFGIELDAVVVNRVFSSPLHRQRRGRAVCGAR